LKRIAKHSSRPGAQPRVVRQPVGAYLQVRPQHLAGVVVDAGAQIEQQVRRLAGREGVAMPAHAAAGGEFGAHAIVAERDGVVARLLDLGVVTEARAVAAAGHLLVAWIELHVTGDRHDQHVAHVRMPGAGEVRVGKTHDGGIVVLITRRPFVGVFEIRHRRIGRELDHAERHRGTGKQVAIASRSDAWIDFGGVRIARLGYGSDAQRCHDEHTERDANQALLHGDRGLLMCSVKRT